MRLFLATLFLLLGLASNVSAAQPSLDEIKHYFDSLPPMTATFIQVDYQGNTKTGKFYLKRPGKLRFEYTHPKGDYIIADGLMINYWDDTLKQANNMPIGYTPADILLRKELDFNGEISVKAQKMSPDGSQFAMTLHNPEEPGSGSVTLFFATAPLKIIKWQVYDALNRKTEILLKDIDTQTAIPASTFIFKEPKGYRPSFETR